MGNRLFSRSTSSKFTVMAWCAGVLLCSVPPAFATPIPLPTGESAIGAFDITAAGSAAAGSRKTGYQGIASGSSPASATGSFSTPAHDGSKASSQAGQGDLLGVLADGELVEAVATQGLMSPDALEPATLDGLAPASGVNKAASGAVNATGSSTLGGPGDPAAALVFQIPESITSLSPSVTVVDVGPGEGGGLHWNADDGAAPGPGSPFAGNILTNTEVPINDAPGTASTAGGGLSVGAAASGAAAVPEPASLLLLGGGLVLARARQLRRRIEARSAN
jgi:ice-binding like protein/PEP-CTERM motif-containing protein